MIITCTKCNTNYITKSSSLSGKARKVKCFKCENIWYVTFTDNSNIVELNFDITDPNCDEFKSLHGKFCPQSCLQKFTLSMLAILIILTGLIFYKNYLIKLCPTTSSLYEQSWLFSTDQVRLSNFNLEHRDGHLWLVGNIINQSDVAKHFPKILITIFDEDNQPIISHQLTSPRQNLNSGEIYQLNNKIVDLADNADHIIVDLGNDFELLIKKLLVPKL